MSGIAERLAEVLLPFVQETCHCHMFSNDGHNQNPPCSTVKNSHRAAQALLPVVEREIAAARGEALREAADDWQAGAGFTLMLRKPTGVPAIDYAQRTLDWLRDRAALSPDPDRGEGEDEGWATSAGAASRTAGGCRFGMRPCGACRRIWLAGLAARGDA